MVSLARQQILLDFFAINSEVSQIYIFIAHNLDLNFFFSSQGKMADFFSKPKRTKLKADNNTSKALPRFIPWVEK